MRPIIVASLFLGGVALLLAVSTAWSEPSWLLVWGALLISASLQLRADSSPAPANAPFRAAHLGAQIGRAQISRTASQSVDMPALDGIRANT